MPFELKHPVPNKLGIKFREKLVDNGKIVFKNKVPLVERYGQYFEKITLKEYEEILSHRISIK